MVSGAEVVSVAVVVSTVGSVTGASVTAGVSSPPQAANAHTSIIRASTSAITLVNFMIFPPKLKKYFAIYQTSINTAYLTQASMVIIYHNFLFLSRDYTKTHCHFLKLI